jgi:CRP-like cAMP-binding protein
VPEIPSTSREAIELLVAKLKQHSRLPSQDASILHMVRPRVRSLARGQDVVRQGDRPNTAVMVLSGMLARYQTIQNGNRQYLSLHIAADMPDLQSLFLGRMDHALGAIDNAEIAMLPHSQLRAAFARSPQLTIALWRQTLIDSAIFRQAITNNGSRTPVERVAHVFCEQLARAREAGLTTDDACSFPLNQTQLGQLLGMSLPTANRAVQQLRNCARIAANRLEVSDWKALAKMAGFDSGYLHLRDAP